MEYTWSFGQFIVGMLFTGIGFVIVWKARWFLQNFGSIPFAEKHLHSEGGSQFFYKLIGILVMIGGMMHAVGLLAPTIQYLVEKFFGGYVDKKS